MATVDGNTTEGLTPAEERHGPSVAQGMTPEEKAALELANTELNIANTSEALRAKVLRQQALEEIA
jgi:hypothetical protein